jgi:hypothetical protein
MDTISWKLSHQALENLNNPIEKSVWSFSSTIQRHWVETNVFQ